MNQQGDWTVFLDETAKHFLMEFLKGWWVQDVCIGEMWVAVATVGGRLWTEAATTIRKGGGKCSSPLHVAVDVPRRSVGKVNHMIVSSIEDVFVKMEEHVPFLSFNAFNAVLWNWLLTM